MALYVVRHQHAAERCQAQDPYMGAKLLNYLSRPNARQHGIQIQGEAIVQGQHTFNLIVEAADEIALRAFMQPFEMAGSVDISTRPLPTHVWAPAAAAPQLCL